MRMAALAAPWPLAALLAVFLAIGLTGFATSPAAAEDGAFVDGTTVDGGLGDCSYSSYAQCQATASGTNSCLANPYYHAKVETQPGRERPWYGEIDADRHPCHADRCSGGRHQSGAGANL